jgi:hypothetical protein
MTFVFAVEEIGGTHVVPVKVSYAFFKQDGPLPDGFFTYYRRYELRAVRDTRCDERMSSLAFVENVDDAGMSLPPTPTLHFLDGAPRDTIKPDSVLPCYILHPGKYKVVGQGVEHK